MVPTRPDARPHPRWPPEGDAASGQRLLDRLHGTPLLDEEGAEAMLRCLGSHSPFLSDLAWRERDALRDILRDGPDAVVASALAKLSGLPDAAPRPRVAQALRAAKRVVALAVAVADLSGAWSLDQVTGALSDLAEAALRKAVSHLLGPHADTSGFVVLAMGKLGARELNYSSDIDLVLLHDPDATSQAGGRGDGSARFTAIARDIVTLMRRATRMAMCFAPTCACAPIPPPPRSASRCRRRSPITRHGADLGTRGHDQGAAGRGRPRRRGASSWRRSARSSGAATSISPPSPTCTR